MKRSREQGESQGRGRSGAGKKPKRGPYGNRKNRKRRKKGNNNRSSTATGTTSAQPPRSVDVLAHASARAAELSRMQRELKRGNPKQVRAPTIRAHDRLKRFDVYLVKKKKKKKKKKKPADMCTHVPARISQRKRAWQTLPFHMRRRTMSHNIKRLPVRLRARAAAAMKKSNVDQKIKKKGAIGPGGGAAEQVGEKLHRFDPATMYTIIHTIYTTIQPSIQPCNHTTIQPCICKYT